jgi:hypothetical protein
MNVARTLLPRILMGKRRVFGNRTGDYRLARVQQPVMRDG